MNGFTIHTSAHEREVRANSLTRLQLETPELNYLMTGKNNTVGNPPINTLSVLFGLTMPLK